MEILLIGAGLMARAIAYALVRHPAITGLLIVDRERERAEEIALWLSDRRVRAKRLDVSAPRAVREVMQGCDVAISAVPYFFNLALATAAVDCGVHFCDLGGNNRIVEAEFSLDEKAKQADLALVPDCGLAPGLVNVLTAGAIEGMTEVEAVTIRVGGLPQVPRPPLDYQIVFSPYGLINEYMEPAVVLRDGEIVTVPSLTGREELSFPPPYEHLEAFHTSGGSSTLPKTLRGRVKNLDYKTIRYSGHLEKVKAMADLGFFDERPLEMEGQGVVPRELAVRLLSQRLTFAEPDVVLLEVTARGSGKRGDCEIRYRMSDTYDERTDLSAMQRSTGFPAAQIAVLLATGKITARGALKQELSVPVEIFLCGLRDQGLKIERTERTR
jgi:lysine 6-dehydrogenase